MSGTPRTGPDGPAGHLLDRPHHDGGPVHVPPGRLPPGARVPVRLRVPTSGAERAVHLRTVRDGEPEIVEARLERSDDHERWYIAEVELHNPVTPYRFLLDEPSGYRWVTARGTFARDVPDTGDFRLTVFPPAPRWARDGAVYQVFPDRFARSDAERPLPDWAEAATWDTVPEARGPRTARQVYGGDLAGVEQHLDHLQRLGVDVLYLTPIFPARSSHRYDATTFAHVDPLLGGDAALASLARAVHERGMRIVGDLTTNHTGAGHEWFVRAQADRAGEEATFYHWRDEDPGYVGWLDHASLPKLDHRAPGLRGRMIEGPGSVVGRWLQAPYDLDGWRIDVANMTGRYRDLDLTHEVARTIRATVQQVRPDGLLVAEHFHDATADLSGDGWHATMNYAGFTRPVWTWLAPGTGAPMLGMPVPMPRRPGAAMVATMTDFAAAVPWTVTAQQWNLLGSHDTARIRTVLGDPALVEVAVGLLTTMPGTPVVFAGDELGLTGETGEHARVAMPWGAPQRWDDRTLEVYRSLLAVRRGSPALRHGGLRWAVVADDAVAFLRETPEERVLVVVARAPWPGAVLPAHLAPGGDVETMYGPHLRAEPSGITLPGEGPTVGIWRLGRGAGGPCGREA